MFVVEIKEVRDVEKIEKEWQKLTDDPTVENSYGYVQTKNIVKEVANIYSQEVNDIDIVAIIDAVNKVNKVQAVPEKSKK